MTKGEEIASVLCLKRLENDSRCSDYTDLDEANVASVLTEALTADVQAVLADDTVAVAAHAAAIVEKNYFSAFLLPPCIHFRL